MNLLLLEDGDFVEGDTALLTGRRAQHAHAVLATQAGETLRVGRRNGAIGTATVLSSVEAALRLDVRLDASPPPRAGLSLLLALPRPKALRKVLPAVASLGVNTLVLVNAHRVEKSYFTSKELSAERLAEHVGLGLEQARDTVPPRLLVRERFRPFVEDELAATFGQARRLLAHPVAEASASDLSFSSPTEEAVVAIGPEGGWIPFELALLQQQGFVPFSLGPRTLRVEVAVPFILGALDALRARAAR